MTARRPHCGTAKPAQQYAGPGERIMEFSSEAGGGLMSLRVVDGRLRVELYRLDPTVDVITPMTKKLRDMTATEKAAVIHAAMNQLQRELSDPRFAAAIEEAERSVFGPREEASDDERP